MADYSEALSEISGYPKTVTEADADAKTLSNLSDGETPITALSQASEE